VKLTFSEEQDELRKELRRFFEAKSPEAEVRRLMETPEGYDPAVWEQMASQLGLQGLAIPEQYGGSGFSCVELGIALEEMGRALLCAPYYSSVVLAANALLLSDDDAAKKEYLPRIASGELLATVGLAEDSGGWDESHMRLRATRSDGGYVLDGHKALVVDGHIAQLILVPARTGSSISLFAVEGDAPGLSRMALDTMDWTRKMARLEFSATPARRLGGDGDRGAALTRLLQLAAVGLASEQVGGAQLVLEMSVQYAKDRVAFGRPIGSFQAIKHMCANMMADVESARSVAYLAARAVAEAEEEVPIAASVAKAFCSEAYARVTYDTIMVHGGVGYTWEHPAHLYFRRARSSEMFLGDANYHRELIAQLIRL
jgi:alkylation response protein AidB-like acyl-CoA dehydrogenase